LKLNISFERRKKAMERLENIHPGEVLEEEFLKPLEITAYRLAKETNIPQTRISEILKRRRRITAEFWFGLQNDYDLEEEKKHIEKDLEKIPNYADIVK
jgi:plasmid maintenance system antidote protein VapI